MGSSLSLPAEDLSSVTNAYKAVLEDIAREINLAQFDLTNASSSTHRHILHSLEQRLDAQVSRCQHLHSSLGKVRAQSSQVIRVTQDQNALDMSELESIVISSQELARKQNRKHAEQMDRLVSSDHLLDKLCQDNLDIMDQLRDIKMK